MTPAPDRALLRPLALAALLAMLLAAGCDRGQKAQPQRPAPEVTFVTLAEEPVTLQSELAGRTAPYRIAEIRPRVNGLIQARLFTEGADVKAGQVLYQIDPAPYQAELDNAVSALGRAEASLPAVRARAERYGTLLSDKALSQQDYDDAASTLNQVRASIKSLQAAVQTARINLGYTKVIAPIDGRIGKSSVTDGAIVTGYQPVALATIQQLDPIYVDVPQSTTELLRLQNRLKEGRINRHGSQQDKVRLILEDGQPYPLEGTLQFSDITVDPTTGSVTLRAIFPNPEGVILPGMFVKAVVTEGVMEKALLVPQQAVQRDPKGNPYALVVEAEEKVGMRPLTLDRAIGDRWLVSSGLKPGDRVIVEGLQMLRPGMVVKSTAAEPAKAGETAEASAPAQQQ